MYDASSIINGYAKCLEIVLKEKIAICFKSLVNKYKKKGKLSYNFNRKYGLLMRGKSISLGTWAIIIKDINLENSSKEIKEFNLEDVKRDRVLDLESRGYISTHLIPAIAELPEEAEVSRFELMEI